MPSQGEWNSAAIFSAIGGDIGGSVFVEAPGGTQLTLSVPRGNWQANDVTIRHNEKDFRYGEVFTSPFSALGRLVLNTGDLIVQQDCVPYEVEGAMAAMIGHGKIEGFGQGEAKIREFFSGGQIHLAFQIGKFAFGAALGWMDWLPALKGPEEVAGAIHLHFGSNMAFLKPECPDMKKFRYMNFHSPRVVDFIKFGATVVFHGTDGNLKTIVQSGRLLA